MRTDTRSLAYGVLGGRPIELVDGIPVHQPGRGLPMSPVLVSPAIRLLVLAAAAACLLPGVAGAAGSTAPSSAGAASTAATMPVSVPQWAARGDRSPAVAWVQAALMASGIDLVGGADGIFGRHTEAAVRRFQADHGLAADGIVGPATATALRLEPTVTALVRRGSVGRLVAWVQAALMASGIDLVGGADGIFGRHTEAAVRRFQADHGLAADGIVGPATATALSTAPGGARPPAGAAFVFPTRRTCTFSDTFGAPRPAGRTHEGVDILAPVGTPVYAMASGRITKVTLATSGSIAGNALRLGLPDGSYVFYAHLDTFAAGLAVGNEVAVGAVLGTVGRTGNASVPHLHLEWHPGGGAAENPYPIVRQLAGCP